MGVFSGIAAFGRRIQSDLVLRTARGFYLIVACVSLAAIILAAVVAIVAQGSTLRFAIDRPVPEVRPPQMEAIAVEDVAARMVPPQNLRFVQDPAIINFTVSEGQALGYFDAATPNQLASYPDDFDVVGGEHASLFQLSRHPGSGRAGLRASAALAQALNAAQAGLSTTTQQQFNIRIIARDQAGQISQPTDLSVVLLLGPPGAPAPQPQEPAAAPLTELQALARDIGLVIDPAQTDVYFDTVRSALRTPRLCGADESPEFVAQYRRGFDAVRERLNQSNLVLFYRGVCDAWNNAIARGEARYANERAAADEVIARNEQARMSLEMQKITARTIRNVAIGIAGTALAAFLTVALFLAFLAMEGHSKALREAVDIMARRREH
jgi:hypothetical protein